MASSKTQFLLRLNDDLAREVARAAIEGRTSKTAIISQCIRETLTSESKQRMIISALARIRGNTDANERLIFTHFKAFEHFVKYFFLVTPPINQDDYAEKKVRMEKRYDAFVEDFIQENVTDPTPDIVQRMQQESQKEIRDRVLH